MIHPTIPIHKSGYDPTFLPSASYIRFFNVQMKDVMYKLRQKMRKLEHEVKMIGHYASADIRLYVDEDFCTLINFTNNQVLFSIEVGSVAVLEVQLANVKLFHYYDRYPEQIKTMSQYNHYVSLKQKYYERQN